MCPRSFMENSWPSKTIRHWSNELLSPVRIISSTYNNKSRVPHWWWQINNEESAELHKKPRDSKNKLNLSNQTRGACRSPYNTLLRWQTWMGLLTSLNPGGCSIYTGSLIFPCKNVFFTSNWWMYQLWARAMVRTIRMVAGLTTGEKGFCEVNSGDLSNAFCN